MRLFQKVFTRNTRGVLDIFDKRVADNDGILVVGQSANGSEHCAICICLELFALVCHTGYFVWSTAYISEQSTKYPV
jgi:hypothetical protein